MKLSIIIPTWNTAQITKQCVESIEKHLHKIDYEIIVVDNGSTDNTYTELTKLKYVNYLKSVKNLGFSKGNNLGVLSAKGEYFLFLNSDMELIDNSLLDAIEYLSSHPSVGMLGPMFLNPDLSPQASVFPPQNEYTAFKEFWLGVNSYSKYIPSYKKPMAVWAISGGAVIVRADLFKNIGGWPEKYFMYFEDLDLCRSMRKKGKKIVYYPLSKVIHRHGQSGKNLMPEADQWRRLIPSSKLYFGKFRHYLINAIIWSGQKWRQIFLKK